MKKICTKYKKNWQQTTRERKEKNTYFKQMALQGQNKKHMETRKGQRKTKRRTDKDKQNKRKRKQYLL